MPEAPKPGFPARGFTMQERLAACIEANKEARAKIEAQRPAMEKRQKAAQKIAAEPKARAKRTTKAT